MFVSLFFFCFFYNVNNSVVSNVACTSKHAVQNMNGVVDDKDDTAEEARCRREGTPSDLDRALRKEVIAAARDIGDSLISSKALRQVSTKAADSFTGMVFVIEK